MAAVDLATQITTVRPEVKVLAAKWETVQSWKQMLNYLDTFCRDRIREAGVRL